MKIVGIDIGGSNIRGVLWNGKKIMRSFEIPMPKTLKNFEKIIIKTIYKLGNNSAELKIGIGIAGVVKNNKVVSATNIKYLKNLNFKQLLNTHCLIVVDNDARCFARAEYKVGAGYNAKSMLMITLGTGVGRAYGKNSNVLNIKRFEKEEKWEKEYQKIHKKEKLVEFLGKKLTHIIQKLNPEVVVLGGGVMMKKGYYEAICRKLYAINKNKGIRHKTYSIRRSKLGKFAGAIGAAMLWKSMNVA